MTIEMITLNNLELSQFEPGNYKFLVKTKTPDNKAPYQSTRFIEARVQIIEGSKHKEISIDVSNQIVTHISSKPLEYEL